MSRTSSDVATEDEFILVAYVEDEAARRIQRLYRARQHAAVSKSAQTNHVERADAKIKPWILAAIAAFLVVLLASHSPALSVTPPPPLLIAPPPLQRGAKDDKVVTSLTLTHTIIDGDERSDGVSWSSALTMLLVVCAIIFADERSKMPIETWPAKHMPKQQKHECAALHEEASTQTPVRINVAGRPIDARGRFLSYSHARALGWDGVVRDKRITKHVKK